MLFNFHKCLSTICILRLRLLIVAVFLISQLKIMFLEQKFTYLFPILVSYREESTVQYSAIYYLLYDFI